MQNITIAGRCGKDAETRTAGSGTVTSFNVAVDQRNGREKSTNWWRVSLWGQRGEKLAQYIRKGDNITVTGEFSLGEYEGKPQLNINASDVALQGGKSGGASGGQSRSNDDGGWTGGGSRGGFDDLNDDVAF